MNYEHLILMAMQGRGPEAARLFAFEISLDYSLQAASETDPERRAFYEHQADENWKRAARVA